MFQCTIHEVRARIRPELDDELAKKAGVVEGGVVKLREMIRERLERDASVDSEKKVQKAVYDALLAANVFEIPSRLEQRERQNNIGNDFPPMEALQGGFT
ncbi:MAG: hypothetical protein HQL81_16360, partial [Magnetococcales bacterium]|nr:hypothetical protein [Magnetococcales bacterium]